MDGLREGRQDQRMISLITDNRAPLGPVFAQWSGQQGAEVATLGAAAEFVQAC